MANHGFVRVAACSPQIVVANCEYNASEISRMIDQAEKAKVEVIAFPELSITAYTCADLFYQQTIAKNVELWVQNILQHIETKSIIAIIGMPLTVGNRMYNVAAVLHKGSICGFVPKTYLPNNGEFYEKRWFASASELDVDLVKFAGQAVPIGRDLIFETPSMRFGIEICEDLWTAIPPSGYMALAGADVIFNLSASDETVGKHHYRKQLIAQQSARCLAGYVYASAGVGESTTDLVFSGSCVIAESGSILNDGKRFSLESEITTGEIDIDKLRCDRIKNSSFTKSKLTYCPLFRTIAIGQSAVEIGKLNRSFSPTPFVPQDDAVLSASCEEIVHIQISGLAKRYLHTGLQTAVIGVSGGLDSTLALLIVVKTFDKLNIPRKNIYGITMPGFGTTGRTYANAMGMLEALGVTVKEIPIKSAVYQHFKDIEQDINTHDITYENSQARERTQILMDYANKVNGMVVGTGNMSELALGWCTYNGDHMSMYAVNAGVPKTLVRTLVKWMSEQMENKIKQILHDVIDTPISPELLPANTDGTIAQKTEDTVGPYVLHDFFMYYMLRFGFSPSKIYFLACIAFDGKYDKAEILKWLKKFYWRFFSQQFKRSCMPDGPKVGSVNLSPRGDWRMPSDASVQMWIDQLDKL